MQQHDVFEWYGDFNQQQAGGANYFSVQRWLQDQHTDPIACIFGEDHEPPIGDEESNRAPEPPIGDDDGDDDQMVDDIDDGDDEEEDDLGLHYRGSQCVMARSACRGAD